MTPPELFIVGGPNGAGKSTMALYHLKGTALKFLSADSIAVELDAKDPSRAAVRAGRLFSRRLAESLANSESIVIESTLAGLSLKKTIQKAKGLGYRTMIIFVFLDSPEACVARIRERVARGGHNVPELHVIRRFTRSLNNFWAVYREMVSEWVLYYNASEIPARIASGSGTDMAILNEGGLAHFLSLLAKDGV
jgi:predicted ABC-type ATPase